MYSANYFLATHYMSQKSQLDAPFLKPQVGNPQEKIDADGDCNIVPDNMGDFVALVGCVLVVTNASTNDALKMSSSSAGTSLLGKWHL